MYVCIYVYIYIYMFILIIIFILVFIYDSYIYIYIRTHAIIYTNTPAQHMQTYKWHIYVYIYICRCICMCIAGMQVGWRRLGLWFDPVASRSRIEAAHVHKTLPQAQLFQIGLRPSLAISSSVSARPNILKHLEAKMPEALQVYRSCLLLWRAAFLGRGLRGLQHPL